MKAAWAAPFVLVAIAALAQRFQPREDADGPRPDFDAIAEYHFVRLEYTDLPQFHRGFGYSSRSGRGNGWWQMDWPDAEDHFSTGVRRLTRIHTGAPVHFRLTDPKLFDHPWIYATQTGWWGLSDEEVRKLREYLSRGGFLVVDDFFGPEQWEVFRDTMERTLPGRPIVDLEDSDSLLHVLYELKTRDFVFIPGTRHLRRIPGGKTHIYQPEGVVPTWRAIYDDRNRVVVAVNFNVDVGDAWEYADWPEYPEAMTSLAYRLGINYLIYSMTH